jgi:hypothetical protein
LRERRTSARGVPYALGWVAFRGMDRYARVPVVGHGVLADRLEVLGERSGSLREVEGVRTWRGTSWDSYRLPPRGHEGPLIERESTSCNSCRWYELELVTLCLHPEGTSGRS